MFSKPIQAIFHVLAQAFLTLANMTADWKPEQMTGSQFLASLAAEDDPATGTEVDEPLTGNPANVFGGDPAEVFGVTTYIMTEKASGFSREEYHASGWNDDDLVEQGYMVASGPKPAPAIAGAAPAPTAHAAAPATSMQADAGQAMTNGSQQATAAASPGAQQPASSAQAAAPQRTNPALVDNSGLPWDARIHSGGRMQTVKGEWTKRKGVGDVEVARVTAELRAAAPSATPFVPLNSGAPAPGAPAPAAPHVAPATKAPAPAPQPAGAGPTAMPSTFTELCKWMPTVGLQPKDALAICKNFGMESFGYLARPEYADYVPMVYGELAALRK